MLTHWWMTTSHSPLQSPIRSALFGASTYRPISFPAHVATLCNAALTDACRLIHQLWLSLPAHEYIPSVQQCKLPQFMHPLTLQLLRSGSVGVGPASLLSSYRWGVGRWAGPLTLPLGATSCSSHASAPATFPYACLCSVKYVCALVTEHTLLCPICIPHIRTCMHSAHMMVEPRHRWCACGTSHCSLLSVYTGVCFCGRMRLLILPQNCLDA